MLNIFIDRLSSKKKKDVSNAFMSTTNLYKGLEQALCERAKGTSVFWRLMLGLGLFQQGVHIYSRDTQT